MSDVIKKVAKAIHKCLDGNAGEVWKAPMYECCAKAGIAALAAGEITIPDKVVLKGAEILLDACSSEKGMLKPWKPFDTAQVAREVFSAMFRAYLTALKGANHV